MKRFLATIIGLAAVASYPAWADIVLVGTEVVIGNGFGADPRALTIQSHGPANPSESGCIAPNGAGGLIAGNDACAPLDGTVGGNEQNPIAFPKQAAVSLSSLGITDASQIGILFDAIQPQNANNNFVTITDLTLKLYDGTKLLATASGTFSHLATNPGNGQSDYLFALNTTEASAFNAAIGGNYSDTIALDSTITFANQSAGPDSYSLINGSSEFLLPVPEPSTTILLGFALLGLALFVRQRCSL
jgi:hypothetical protein